MTLLETLAPKAPPVRLDESGTLRVGNTRVTMDTLVFHYNEGASPEAIRDSFDTLSLAAIHGAIEYYLEHKDVVDGYIAEREREAEAIRAEIESQPGYAEWRSRLRERAAQRRG